MNDELLSPEEKKRIDEESVSDRHRAENPDRKLFVSGMLGGLSGALIVIGLFGLLLSKGIFSRFFPSAEEKKDGVSVETKRVIEDDNAIISTVERSMPGTVSIVITKDVSKYRNFFQSPFGGLPFFFGDPFDGGRGQGGVATERQQVGSGSGFFVSDDGLIVTNKHVVSDESADYTVLVGEKEYTATVLARDPSNDIALVKIEGSGFTELPLGDSDVLKPGQTVIAIGNPLGEFANSVSRGIVSGLKRSVTAGSGFGDTEQLLGIIQTDAAINPGNSGGPLLNVSGEVIGVNVAMAQGAENIGFAIPINQVKRVINQVKTTGKISTAFLGVRYVPIDEAMKKQLSLSYDYGVLVARGETVRDFAVIPGSPADKAGLMENDIILEIDGTKLDKDHPLSSVVGQYAPGTEVTLKVWHKGEEKDVKVQLEERK